MNLISMFIFTIHALTRIEERKISKKDVELAIKDPSKEYSSFDNRIVAQRKIKKKTLEVVYIRENNKIIILTVYWV